MGTSQQLQQAFQLIKQGQRQEAAQILVPIVRAEPNNADAWWLLANAVTNTEQQRRALEKVLSLRPGDDRAQKKLAQLTGAPPPPPPSTTAPTVMMPSSSMRQSDPFASDPFASDDPFGMPPASAFGQPQPPPPTYTTPPPVYGAPSYPPPPAPVAPPPRRSGGCNCCLILLVVLLLLCAGAFIGSIALLGSAVGGINNIAAVFSGSVTPDPNSIVGQIFATIGIRNIDDLEATFNAAQGTFEGDIDILAATLTAGFGALDEDMQQTANAAATMAFSNLSPELQQTATAAANLFGDAQQTAAALMSTSGVVAGSNEVGSPLPEGYTDRGALTLGQQASGNIAANSGDRYTFNATAGQTFTITMREDKDSGLDTLIRLYGPDNRLVAYDDDGLGEGFNSRLEFTAETGGTYTIVATSFSGGSGAYTIMVE
jgi:hypothetical protein